MIFAGFVRTDLYTGTTADAAGIVGDHPAAVVTEAQGMGRADLNTFSAGKTALVAFRINGRGVRLYGFIWEISFNEKRLQRIPSG